ncbi:MAG TPA: response regulator [Kofleriaceae bacterium]|nr:response regulator [Kofleriaceae bacterium]
MTTLPSARVERARKIVVVVDDEPGACETLQDVFEDEGYTVHTATDGVQALALLRSLPHTPCAVLLDLLMPVMDGNAVYREMQAHSELREVAVVVTTSDPSIAPPGVLIMRKPVNLQTLIETVRRCCDDWGEPAG